MWLKGLHRLTGLQHLAVQLRDFPAGALGGFHNALLLQQAIPDLTHLTALHLDQAAAHDMALEHISKLTCLQELELTWVNNTVTQASFRELPCSLTRLKFMADLHPDIPDDNAPQIHFRYLGELFLASGAMFAWDGNAVHVLHSMVWCDRGMLCHSAAT